MEGKITTLAELLDNIKLFEKETLAKGLKDKPLRLCIDGNQIVEIKEIELVPRGRDLTLFIHSSKNIGYTEAERHVKKEMSLAEELQSYPRIPSEAFEIIEGEDGPQIITKEDLTNALNKEDDDKDKG
jgi:translation elongation factor EF-1alpha